MSTTYLLVLAVSLLWLLYVYFLYPALLLLLSTLKGDRRDQGADFEPTVTILTAAFNEADVIAENIENKLSLDYPVEKLDMIVISDESTDGTDEIVQGFARAHPDRIRLIRQVPREGKTAGLNLAVPQARGEILVFADANSIYEKSALRHLVRNFARESVGYVTGKMIYTNSDGSVTGDGCTTYMRYENLLRAWESNVGSVVGVDGGVDACRKSLYKTMGADQLPDFVLPLRVVEQGHRVAYEPEAILREPALGSSAQEYRMRVRVALRALWALYDLRQLLNPLRHPLFAWQLTSHKLLRYTAFLPQLLAFVANALLIEEGAIFRGLFLAQALFYVLAALGYALSKRGASMPLITIPFYFSLLNISCLHAVTKFLRGQKQALWQPRVG